MADAGLLFAQHDQRILDEIHKAELALRGTFRINLPMSFGMSHLSPLIAEFLSYHPALQFQTALADRYVDVIGEGVDMAIRIGTLGDSTLIALPLGELKRVICCSPDSRQPAGTPQQPEALLQHTCLRYGREGQNGWELQVNGKAKWLAVQGPMMSNNGEVLRDAALAGLGRVLLPAFIVESALQRGELVTVRWTAASRHRSH